MSANFQQNCLVDTLAANVNQRCLNPVSQNTYQLSDIVQLMDQEMSGYLVPLLKKVQQEYFVMNVDQPIVAGQTAYVMPPRAVGNALRDIVLVDASGNEINLNNLMREYVKTSFPYSWVPSIWSFGQYLSGNEINLYNTLIQSYTAYTLRFITERRPGQLTLSSNCGQITAITGNVVTLNVVDPTWTTNTTFDIINQLPPFQSIHDDQTITLIAGNQLTFSSIPKGLAKGQWVCPAMTSCIPQIPYDAFTLLTERTVSTIAEAMDMSQLLAASQRKCTELESNILALIRPREQGSPQVIINKNVAGAWTGYGWRNYR